MASETRIILTDDIDGGSADETLTIALDGRTAQIDLSKANADRLRAIVTPYLDAGRSVPAQATSAPGGARKTSGGTRTQGDAAKVRAWAQANGLDVSKRGRIPAEVHAAYAAAQGAQA